MKVDEIDLPGMGTYAKLEPGENTKHKIGKILNMLNIPNPTATKDLHLTVVYSRKQCDSIKEIPVKLPVVADGKSFGIFPNREGTQALVLKIAGDGIHELHQLCREEHGATHDFPEFDPHITLSYDYGTDELPNDSLLEYFKGLVFNKYVVEPLDLNWTGDKA